MDARGRVISWLAAGIMFSVGCVGPIAARLSPGPKTSTLHHGQGADVMDMKSEVAVLPVADDRAKAFYHSLGWRLAAAAGRDLAEVRHVVE